MSLTSEIKAEIDSMTQYQLCFHWRFDPVGSDFFKDLETGEYFQHRLKELGGFTPKISKQLGWSEKVGLDSL